ADVNNDGWPDFFLASSVGNVLFINDGRGKFREVPDSRQVFAWKDSGGDNMVCGVSFADVNRDGLLDAVLGQHFKSPWREPVPIRLYLHRGIKDGNPVYEDITAFAGLKGLPIKGPHVEFQDFDNDGWPDIYVSIVKFAGDRTFPLIYKHLGIVDGLPRFREDAMAVNDFPTAEDSAIKRSGDFFQKVNREHKIMYTAPGPSGDFDNDGRLDLFLPSWWTESRSLLLHNETVGGNWLQVQLQCKQGNRMGIGAKLKIYPAGKLGDASALLGCRDVATGYGYASAQPASVHFGLGKVTSVDIEINLPHGKGTATQTGVKANQKLTLKL
ncbi:MAG: CRTAC1 family protein, partial [Planctomycetales bacterium]|nr:CRTAC1 family protein [Planctomycetales bacterium]